MSLAGNKKLVARCACRPDSDTPMGLTLTDQVLLDISRRYLPDPGTVQVAVHLPTSPLQIGVARMLTEAGITFVELDDPIGIAELTGLRAVLTDKERLRTLPTSLPTDPVVLVLTDGASEGDVETVSPSEQPAAILERLIAVAGLTPDRPLLTAREREVLSLAAAGLANPEIGERCYVAPETVKSHLQSVFRKLDVPDRASAVYRAVKLGIIA